jgi:hypothetical protein
MWARSPRGVILVNYKLGDVRPDRDEFLFSRLGGHVSASKVYGREEEA